MQRVAYGEIAGLQGKEESRDAEFSALVARQARFAYRFAYRVAYALLRDAYDAEDAVQEMFLKLYRGQDWRALQNEKAFIARCTWRVALTHRSAQRIHDPVADVLPSGAAGPEQHAVSASRMEQIHRMIASLPEMFRQPLVLSALEDLNSREIAVILGIPEGTVRTRLLRARQILKEKLTREEEAYGR